MLLESSESDELSGFSALVVARTLEPDLRNIVSWLTKVVNNELSGFSAFAALMRRNPTYETLSRG